MAGGNAQHYAQIASLAGFTVAMLCVIAWLFRLSALVKLISDSVLVGFKAGAGLTIAMTQLPSLIGVGGGGHNFFERAALLAGQIGHTNYLVLAIGFIAIMLLVFGEPLAARKNPSHSALLLCQSSPPACLGFPRLACPLREIFPLACPPWKALR